MPAPRLELRGVSKTYHQRRTAGRSPARHFAHRRSRHRHRAAGPQRLRQDHPAQPRRRHGFPHRRRSPHRWPRHRVALRIRTDRAAPHAHRLRLPVLPAAAHAHRARKCRAAAAARRRAPTPPTPRATACAGWASTEKAASFPYQLSGGQMQRVAIARALVHSPDLLIADEPTGNLDTASGDQVLALLREAATRFGATVLMATHSAEAAAIADVRVQPARRPHRSPSSAR